MGEKLNLVANKMKFYSLNLKGSKYYITAEDYCFINKIDLPNYQSESYIDNSKKILLDN